MRRTQREADGTPRRRVSDSEKNRRTTHCWTAADPSLPFDWLDDSIIDRGSSFFCVYLCVSVCLCVCVCVCVRNKERRNRHRALARPLNSRWCHWSIGHWNGGEVGKRRGKPPIDATSWRSAFHGVCFLSNRRVARTTWEQKKLETKNNRDPNRDGTPKTKTQNKTENERSAEKKTTWQTSRRSVCRPITERDGSSAKNFNRRCRS